MRGAFRELIETRGLDEISVRDITRVAGLSYPTFFRNYASKSDLLGEIAKSEVRAMLSSLAPVVEKQDPHLSSQAICEFVGGRRGIWGKLLKSDAIFPMKDEFTRVSIEYANRVGRVTLTHMPVELATAFVVSAIFEILAWWFRQPEDYPIENVIDYLNTLVLRTVIG